MHAAGVEGSVIVGKLLEKSEEESLNGRLGYNAATDKFEDLVAAGVIDPVKVPPAS
jgi:chaperonin GroEL